MALRTLTRVPKAVIAGTRPGRDGSGPREFCLFPH